MNGELEKVLRGYAEDLENLAKKQGTMTDEFTNHFKASSRILTSYANSVADSTKIVRQNTQEYGKMQKAQERLEARQEKYKKGIDATRKKIEEVLKNDDNKWSEKEREKEIKHLNHKLAMQINHAKKVADFESGLLKERFDEQESRFKAYQELTKNHQKQMQRLGGFASGMGSKAKGGDLSGVASGGLEGMGAILKQLGGVGGKLGMVATALGATVGVLGVFVALMFEADKKAKDMNKNFMQGASGLDLMGKNFQKGQLTERLQDMRDMAFDVGSQFRMSADDVAQLSSSFNQFGLRYDEMAGMVRGTNDPVKALEQNLEVAITKSKMLGVEASTIAEQIAQMNENFAMDLSQIDDAFSAIYMSAQTTGIATQKFFAMITQVTGGMSLLNVDFAQTAAIAGELVESLGEAAGSKFLGELANRGRSKSYQDRMKSSLLAGGATSRIGRKGLDARAKRIQESAGYQNVMNNKAFQDQMRTLGIQIDPSKGVFDQLAGMTQAQQRTMIQSMGTERFGGDPAVARQMRELSKLGKAVVRGDSTVQMGSFNAGENLAQMLAEAKRFGDLEKGESLSGMDRMVLEQITGRSGGDLDEFVTMVDSLQSNMATAESYGAIVKEKGLEGAAAELKFESVDKMQEYLKTNFKLALDEQGRLMSSETGTLVGSVEDYAIHMGDSMKGSIEEAMSMEDAMTSEIVQNTASTSVLLENMIGKNLNKISGFVEGIYSWLFGSKGATKDQKDARNRTNRLTSELQDLYALKESRDGKLGDLRTKKKTGKASKKELDQLEALEAESTLLHTRIARYEKERTMLLRDRSMKSTAKMRSENAQQDLRLRAKAKGQTVDDVLKEGVSLAQSGYNDNIANRMLHSGKGISIDRGDHSQQIDADTVAKAYTGKKFQLTKADINSPQFDVLRSQGFTDKDILPLLPDAGTQDYSGIEGSVAERARSQVSNRSALTPSAMKSGAFDPMKAASKESEVLENLSEEQYKAREEANKLGKEGNETLDSLTKTFESNAGDTEEMKKFQEKGLPPAVGAEVLKALVTAKLVDVATAAGMSLDEVIKARQTQTDKDSSNDVHVASKIDAKIAALDPNATDYAQRKAELEKQKETLKTLNIKDAELIDGKMIPKQKGSIITTPDGTSYHTDPADNMLIGTKVGKPSSGGGGGIHIGTVVVKADDPATFERKLRAVAKTKSGRNAMSGRSR